MEGAYREYRRLAPDVQVAAGAVDLLPLPDTRAMGRFHPAQRRLGLPPFTFTSTAAATAIRDRYVAYYMGDLATFSVTAHEGFHQYVARNFKSRVAPFLEEGIACMYEDVRWDGQVPYWDLEVNAGRLSSLRTAVDQKRLFSLSQLAMTHAGQVVSGPPGAHRGFLWRELGVCAVPLGCRRRALPPRSSAHACRRSVGNFIRARGAAAPGSWDPKSAKVQLEHYFQQDITTLDREFQGYESKLVNRAVELDLNQ